MAACHRQGVVTLQCGTYAAMSSASSPPLVARMTCCSTAWRFSRLRGRVLIWTTVVDALVVAGESTLRIGVVVAAAAAAPAVAAATPAERAGWLRRSPMPWSPTHSRSRPPPRRRETGLGLPRLDGEVLRCANQLRFCADVCVEGSWLGATIDHATATTPDLRRVQTPLARSPSSGRATS